MMNGVYEKQNHVRTIKKRRKTWKSFHLPIRRVFKRLKLINRSLLMQIPEEFFFSLADTKYEFITFFVCSSRIKMHILSSLEKEKKLLLAKGRKCNQPTFSQFSFNLSFFFP